MSMKCKIRNELKNLEGKLHVFPYDTEKFRDGNVITVNSVKELGDLLSEANLIDIEGDHRWTWVTTDLWVEDDIFVITIAINFNY